MPTTLYNFVFIGNSEVFSNVQTDFWRAGLDLWKDIISMLLDAMILVWILNAGFGEIISKVTLYNNMCILIHHDNFKNISKYDC